MKALARSGRRKSLGVALIVAACACGASPRSWTQEVNHRSGPVLTVRLKTDKAAYRVGETVLLRVEVTNRGTEPVLVANDVSLFGGSAARLDVNLKDSYGQLSPKTEMFIDRFVGPTTGNSIRAALSSWLLLRPGACFIAAVPIDASIFGFLTKPGKYTVSGIYSSPGFSYPPAYRQLGLSDEDVQAILFRAWTGKIATNEISFRLTSR